MRWLIKWIYEKMGTETTRTKPVIVHDVLVGFTTHAREMIQSLTDQGYVLQPGVIHLYGETVIIMVNWTTSWMARVTHDGSSMEFCADSPEEALRRYTAR